MKKKLKLYESVIMAVICFSITISFPCMAENSNGIGEYMDGYCQERAVSIQDPEVPGPLERVDIRLDEMADQVDLEDASSVASYIRELYSMMHILHKERYESVPETDLEERIVSLPIVMEGGASAYKTRDGRGGVIWECNLQSCSMLFIFDKELIGLQIENVLSRFTFAEQLPKWKDDETSMDVPLVGDNPRDDEYLEENISWESVRQRYADIIEETWSDC